MLKVQILFFHVYRPLYYSVIVMIDIYIGLGLYIIKSWKTIFPLPWPMQ